MNANRAGFIWSAAATPICRKVFQTRSVARLPENDFLSGRCGRSNKYWKNARPRLGRIESPPLEATPASRALGEHALRIYAEIGKKLVVDAVAEGGGTDAAFASLETKAPVLERFGLQGFGAHSNDAEYVAVDSIEPRLYLLTRLIMDVSQGKDSQ
jgi:acetylornithine deacetylase/succinyl-diaminopimelate desuccinylase-like protein